MVNFGDATSDEHIPPKYWPWDNLVDCKDICIYHKREKHASREKERGKKYSIIRDMRWHRAPTPLGRFYRGRFHFSFRNELFLALLKNGKASLPVRSRISSKRTLYPFSLLSLFLDSILPSASSKIHHTACGRATPTENPTEPTSAIDDKNREGRIKTKA